MTVTDVQTAPASATGAAFDRALDDFFTELELDVDLDVGTGDVSRDLRRVSESAVDPLEIVAAFESAGIAPAALVTSFGQADLFELAERIYRRMPMRAAARDVVTPPRSGGRKDLARGAIFAVPGFAITEVLRAGGAQLSWWCLPLAVTFGWAMSQAVASTGYVLLGRRDAPGAASAHAVLLSVAGLGSVLLFAAVGGATGGTSWPTVAVGASIVAYMAASAVLILHEREVVLAWSLVPTSVAIAASLTVGTWPSAAKVALVAQGTAAVGVIVAGCTYARWVRLRRPQLQRRDVADASAHFLHGAYCGAAVSAVLLSTALVSDGDGFAFAAWPLLLSLGVMEWQHRTLGASVWRLQHSLGSVRRFATMSGWALFRSVALYATVLLVLATLAGAAQFAMGYPVATVHLAAQLLLGVALFVDLVALAQAGIRRTLAVWVLISIVAAIGCTVLVRSVATVHVIDIWRVALVVAALHLLALSQLTWRAVRTPLT